MRFAQVAHSEVEHGSHEETVPRPPFALAGDEAACLRGTPWGCAMEFEFPPGAEIHRGVFRVIREQMAGRRPGAYPEGNVVHASFALADGGAESRDLARNAAAHLGTLMPNGKLRSLEVVRIDFGPSAHQNSPHAVHGSGGTALRLVDQELPQE